MIDKTNRIILSMSDRQYRMEEAITLKLKELENTQLKILEVLDRIVKKIEGDGISATDDELESKPILHYHKDIHGNKYDPKKAGGQQHDFSEPDE